MSLTKSPLIVAGQIYLNSELNEYLIVTSNNRGQIYYEGVGFKGQAEDMTFIERFQPVDPADVEVAEIAELLSFCADNIQPLVGYTG